MNELTDGTVEPRVISLRKRNDEQIKRDRSTIAELRLKGHSFQNITDIINGSNYGYTLSLSQIKNDFKVIKVAWMQKQDTSYTQYLNQELARVDAVEKELWKMLRDSAKPDKSKQVTKVARKIADDIAEGVEISPAKYKMIVSKIVTTTSNAGADIKIMSQIIEMHKERRRLLGLYAPKLVGVNVNKVVTVKGYKSVSPDDWPSNEIVEGEFEEN